MLRTFRQRIGPVCCCIAALLLSRFAIARAPVISSAAPANIFSPVRENLSEAADRAGVQGSELPQTWALWRN